MLYLACELTGRDRNPRRLLWGPFTIRRRDARARSAPVLGGVGCDIASWCAAGGREAAADTVAATGDVGSAVTSAAAELSGSPSAGSRSAAGTLGAGSGATSGDRRSARGCTASSRSAP